MLDVDGAAAVVTGAGGGLGLGLARRLGERGARVVLADVDADALDAAVVSLAGEGIEALAVATDVTDAASVETLAARAVEAFGPVAVVCANAGVSVLGRAWELGLDDWRWVHAVNVWGTIHVVHAFVPAMVAADAGHVVVTASNTAVTARARYGAYGSSKHAVLSIAESLQQDLTEVGSAVKVTTVMPGPIRSRMADAEHRRPPAFGSPSADPTEVEQVRRYLDEHGVEPDEMAAQVLAAADEGRFYLFTHPTNVAMVRERAADIERGDLPLRVQAPV